MRDYIPINQSQFEKYFYHYNFYLLLIFILSFLIISLYSLFGFQDFYDDSYHHFYISLGTLENSFIYTDFKSNHYLWLPGFHYFGSFLLFITRINTIEILELANVILGSIIVLLVSDIVFKITKNYFFSFSSALLIMLFPWFVIFSNFNMPENLAIIAILIMIWGWINEKFYLIYFGWIIGIITRYEIWIYGFSFFFGIALFHKKVKNKLLIFYSLLIFLQWIIIWSLWNFFGTENYLQWIANQSKALNWESYFAGNLPHLFLILDLYFSWIGYLIPLAGCLIFYLIYFLIKNDIQFEKFSDNENWSKSFIFINIMTTITIIRISSAVVFSLIPIYYPRFVLIDLSIIVLLLPCWLNIFKMVNFYFKTKKLKEFNISNRLKSISKLLLILFIIFSFFSQSSVISSQDYILTPSKSAGSFLESYMIHEGYLNEKVLIDSPTIAYYAGLSITQMIPSSAFRVENPLEELLNSKIKFIVAQNSSFSEVYFQFPFLLNHPLNFNTENGIIFQKIFEYDGWELNYGVKPIIIYFLSYL
ncbi:MAG: hypothetical protein HeimC3_51920 [Candidatus Heimdallarchaeota archaeon LC_3]|nr:MAG: hypothetical protein HeimC3_51920 [Candidatus Heimdallarchaeota archaeon LC_3]